MIKKTVSNLVWGIGTAILFLASANLVLFFWPTVFSKFFAKDDPIIFFTGDLVSRNSVDRAKKVVTLIDNLISQNKKSEVIVASTGDNEQEDRPRYADYNNYFGSTYGTFVNRGIFRQVRGNHDNQDDYAQYFGENSYLSAEGLTNYSYDLGTWHIVAIDQISDTITKESLEYLKYNLNHYSNYKCQIVYWHVPTYSLGAEHGDSLGLLELNQIAYDAGVEIIVNGHDHNYQRFFPMNANGGKDLLNGVTNFVVGIGGEDGRKFYKPSVAQQSLAVFKDNFFGKEAIGTLMFKLHKDYTDFAVYDANSGSVVDSGSIKCR